MLDPLTAAGLGKHAKNAYNDYVYFWCWATWQAVTKQDGPGVVAFITASSYLDGVSLGGLRSHLRDVFDELWIVDLGGEGRGARVDESVFAIRTPVAIAFGIRTGAGRKDCDVRYLAIEGTREEKLKQLADLDLLKAPAGTIVGEGLNRLTPTSTADYHAWPEITDLFPWNHSGSQLKRTWPIGPSKSLVRRRWDQLLSVSPSQRRVLMRETPDRNTTSLVKSLQNDVTLKPVSSLRHGSSPDGLERYGYRSFDRQWIISDNRLSDRPRPPLWDSRGPRQVYLTTLTSTKLGGGPVVTATPYVPDLHYFRGSYGAKDVMPPYRDHRGERPNVTSGLLKALSDHLGTQISVKDLMAYVYGLTATSAFAERFADELGEGAGPVRIPMTADPKLFSEGIALGTELLRWHTWGERFGDETTLPPGAATELKPVTRYPDSFHWDSVSETLHIGDGAIGPVPAAVWNFDVSGLRPLQSWLGYRMKKGKGKNSSPLDDIRPERWSFTTELLTVIAILEHTIELTPKATNLLNRVVSTALIDVAVLPKPNDAERKPPKD